MGGTKGLEDFLDGESDDEYQEEEEPSDLDEPPGTSEDDSDASSVESGPPKVIKKAVEPAKKAVAPSKKVAEPAKKVVKKTPEAAKKVVKKPAQGEKPSASQDTPFTKASGAVQQSDAKTQAKSAPRKRKGGDQNEAPAEKKKATAKAASAAPAFAAPAAPASATVSQKPPIVHVALWAAGATLRMSGTPAECGGGIHCVFEGMGFGPDIFVNVPVRSFSITAPRGSAFFNEAVSSPDDTEQNIMYFSINDADAFMLVYKIRDALGVLRSMTNKVSA